MLPYKALIKTKQKRTFKKNDSNLNINIIDLKALSNNKTQFYEKKLFMLMKS